MPFVGWSSEALTSLVLYHSERSAPHISWRGAGRAAQGSFCLNTNAQARTSAMTVHLSTPRST